MSIPEFIKKFRKFDEKIYLFGRLDYNASGLMLFTNSLELKNTIDKVVNTKYVYLYKIKIDGNISEEIFGKMIKPQKIKDLEVNDLKINIKKQLS